MAEQSHWQRFKQYVKETPDRVEAMTVASLKSFPSQSWQWLKDSINQARDELGKAFFHEYAGYMPWPEQQQHHRQDDKVVTLNTPKHEPLIEAPAHSAQILDFHAQARQAVEGVEIGPPQSISLRSLGDLSPSSSPQSARPSVEVPEIKPLSM